MINLRRFQSDAIENAYEFFSFTKEQLEIAQSKQTIINHNGCILIESPTGSGKTLMATHICDKLVKDQKIIWFWFTPFSGLVSQTEAVIRENTTLLNLRDIKSNRTIEELRNGDIYVATWASVAANNADSKKSRQSSETKLSIDKLVSLAKLEGYKIGVVIDEAHHGFKKGTESHSFYKDVLSPEYTLLITATPNDTEVEKFKTINGFKAIHKISISRQDCVDAGLVKKGIKAISYIATETTAPDVDYERTAYRHALKLNKAIKKELTDLKVDIEPLILVQVESGPNSVENAKKKLLELGLNSSEIAIHTADEPDENLIALAADNAVKVLIFKVAVALGFDAPRAFTLVSTRRSKDTNFGIQLVGRILRVHKTLQLKEIPDILEYGYVFLADYSSQEGLVSAAQRINEIKTELIPNTDALTMVTITDENGVVSLIDQNSQVVMSFDNGNVSLESTVSDVEDKAVQRLLDDSNSDNKDEITVLNTENPSNTNITDNDRDGILENLSDRNLSNEPTLDDLEKKATDTLTKPNNTSGQTTKGPDELFDEVWEEIFGDVVSPSTDKEKSKLINSYNYPLRNDIKFPEQYLREKYNLESIDLILETVVNSIQFDSKILLQVLSRKTEITERSLEIFTKDISDSKVRADLSMKEISSRAQKQLFENDFLNGQKLYKALINKLKAELDAQGLDEELYDENLEDGLYIILTRNPNLLKSSIKKALKTHIISDAGSLIEKSLTSSIELPPSKLNIYKVFPDKLNRWEKRFAEILDNDTTGTVLWWARNTPRTSWGVSVCLSEAKYDYWPDFIVGVKNRQNEHQILLIEVKGDFEKTDSIIKARAEHKDYGKVLMVHWKDENEWYTVSNNSDGSNNILDRIFRMELLTDF